MATIVHIDKTNNRGSQVANALQQIRSGLAALSGLNGQREQTIAVDAATFGAAFGIANASEAQAFSDRWASIDGGVYTGLDDFLDATLAD